MTKKATDKHSNLIISLNKITIKKNIRKALNINMNFLISIFFVFLIFLILPIGIAVKNWDCVRLNV